VASEAAPFLGAVVGVTAGVAALAPLQPASSDPTDFIDNTAATLESRVAAILQDLNDALTTLGNNVIYNNNFTDMPAWALTGSHNYKNEITNFFQDGKFFTTPESWLPVTSTLTSYIKNNLVGLVLSSTNAYILVNAHPADDDCGNTYAGSILSINGGPSYCYTIEGPGPGALGATPDTYQDQEQYTVAVGSDVMSSITGYGASLQDIVTNAVKLFISLPHSELLPSEKFHKRSATLHCPPKLFTKQRKSKLISNSLSSGHVKIVRTPTMRSDP